MALHGLRESFFSQACHEAMKLYELKPFRRERSRVTGEDYSEADPALNAAHVKLRIQGLAIKLCMAFTVGTWGVVAWLFKHLLPLILKGMAK